jgi:hypothetical protein
MSIRYLNFTTAHFSSRSSLSMAQRRFHLDFLNKRFHSMIGGIIKKKFGVLRQG